MGVGGTRVWWPAPGKLNLFLHVVGRRADGYHELQTVFQFVEHGDWLRFEPSRSGEVTRSAGPAEVAEDEDLAVRAARRLKAYAGTEQGAAISIDKRLPLGAGLGGGSSDAATTLVALNHLWGLGLSASELAAVGLELGADVPVFVRGQAAWAEGVGETLTAVELPETWFAVVVPPVAVSTGEMFSDPELTRNSPRMTISDFLSGRGANDCEVVAARRYPLIREALDRLAPFGEARMTGTGSAVFTRLPSEVAARRALDALPSAWRGFPTRGRNRSPLLEALDAARQGRPGTTASDP